MFDWGAMISKLSRYVAGWHWTIEWFLNSTPSVRSGAGGDGGTVTRLLNIAKETGYVKLCTQGLGEFRTWAKLFVHVVSILT